jgi:dienelactone hydrolase
MIGTETVPGGVMAEVLFLHHICGLTSGVRELADGWRAAGQTVHLPDLFEGRTFETIAAGSEYVDGVGFEVVRARAVRAAEELSAELVYAGISMGVMAAQSLAVTRAGARGAVLIEAFVGPVAGGEPRRNRLDLELPFGGGHDQLEGCVTV